EQYVKSPYTQNNLPFIMNTDGEVFIDYRSDFMNIMEENDFTFKENEDIDIFIMKYHLLFLYIRYLIKKRITNLYSNEMNKFGILTNARYHLKLVKIIKNIKKTKLFMKKKDNYVKI